MNSAMVQQGFDLFLTDIGPRYVVAVGTKKGEDLLDKYAASKPSTQEEIAKRAEIQEKIPYLFSLNTVTTPYSELPRLLGDHAESKLFEELAEKCFSCGSCNLVCPTCYCFDVQDDMSLNLSDGERVRFWDGCLLDGFRQGGLGGEFPGRPRRADPPPDLPQGEIHLRKIRGARLRGLREMRLRLPAGHRQPRGDLQPVKGGQMMTTAAQVQTGSSASQFDLSAHLAEIARTEQLTKMEKLFEIRLEERPGAGPPARPVRGSLPLRHRGGPHLGLLFPDQEGLFRAGRAGRGQRDQGPAPAWTRVPAWGSAGPFGKGFPVEEMKGKDILFVAGGIGLVPLRSLDQLCLGQALRFRPGHHLLRRQDAVRAALPG